MIVIPAIDLKDGKVVRLHQGKFDQVTEYSRDPLAVAMKWKQAGAQWLHLVDLDGALTGEMKNLRSIIDIAEHVNINIEVGGGIRNKQDIAKLVSANIKRIIIGTRVIEDKAFLKEIMGLWANRIAVSLDCSNGMVAQRGWTQTSNIKATDLVKELESAGVQCIIYTDIARDGTLKGPNYEGLKEMLAITKISVIASGGVASLDDIKKLLALKTPNLIGAITGKAIYEDKLDLAEAIKLSTSQTAQ
jgi:phosphoribosylformimino-5-aminoimidazole carboxamide ribotide isomerase